MISVERRLKVAFRPLVWSAAACGASLVGVALVGWPFDRGALARPGLWLIATNPVASFAFLLAFMAVTLLAGSLFSLLNVNRLRRASERAMVFSEGHYRHAEQVGHIGHWRIEFPSGATQWSDEVFEILGLPWTTRPSMEKKIAVCHPDDRDEFCQSVERAIRDGVGWEIRHRVLRPDGEIRYVRSHGIPERNAQGALTAIFGVIADTTALERSQREAEAATVSKAAFLANMSHEIRTPMNGVMGFVELLLESRLDPKQRRHLLLVQESAQALLKLLNDILDLSKIEAGHFDLNPAPTDVRHDIRQCVRLMNPLAEQKGIALRAVFADNFPDSVVIDSLRFRQILFNLLGNAVKFTSEGSVCVTLTERQTPLGNRIMEIAVADTGPGIAKERQTAIFNAFVQADNSVSRRFGGTGLGLAISRRLALLMGGAIELESDEHEGTTMTLSLPLVEAFATAAGAVAPAVRDLGAALDAVEPIGGPASILLVEDTDINRELITDMLQGLGHRVDVAENGSAALKMARKLKDDPQRWDMILMDVHMAVMDGLTATRAIRALGGRARTIPIVALTANAFPAEIQECVEAGMDDHIAKPSGIPELRQAIDHWCKDARSAAPEKGDCAIPKASLGDRFEARMRKSRARLTEIGSALASAGEDKAAQLLEEAAEIAHMLAGTAGMFGKAWLGTVAQQSETALKRILKRPRPNAKAVVPIDQLVAALETSTQQPQPDSTAAKVANA